MTIVTVIFRGLNKIQTWIIPDSIILSHDTLLAIVLVHSFHAWVAGVRSVPGLIKEGDGGSWSA